MRVEDELEDLDLDAEDEESREPSRLAIFLTDLAVFAIFMVVLVVSVIAIGG